MTICLGRHYPAERMQCHYRKFLLYILPDIPWQVNHKILLIITDYE